MKNYLIIGLISMVLFVSGCEQYNSIKSIAQNPKSFVGTELKIKGTYDWVTDSIVDSNEYHISINGGACTESSRNYVQGGTYTLKGTIKENYYPYGKDQYVYTFQCSEPMN